jgi:hypothetical protein
LLELGERLPIRRIGQGIAQVRSREDPGAEEEATNEEDSPAKDHGFDFGLFNTMLARC